MTSSNLNQRPHIVWLDVLRFVAIFMVLISHSADPFNASVEARTNPDFNLWGSAFGSLVRACVPLFVMMTGLLLLPVKQEMGSFYKKRISRVLYPFFGLVRIIQPCPVVYPVCRRIGPAGDCILPLGRRTFGLVDGCTESHRPDSC